MPRSAAIRTCRDRYGLNTRRSGGGTPGSRGGRNTYRFGGCVYDVTSVRQFAQFLD
jgi:hypothetical protein